MTTPSQDFEKHLGKSGSAVPVVKLPLIRIPLSTIGGWVKKLFGGSTK